MKNPRIKKICDIADISVFIVDGNIIRKDYPEFTNFGQHFHNKFIPLQEFWIDKEGLPDELPFYLTHLIIEYIEMKKNKSYKEALELANKYELVERHRSKKFKNAPKSYPEQIKKIQQEKILIFDGIDIYLVDDELVRDLYFDNFTEGGNSEVYNFIPKNTIWISKSIDKKEISFVILHEYVEQFLMSRGMSYDNAHIFALKIEWKRRKLCND